MNNLPTPAGVEPFQVNGRSELKNPTPLESLDVQDYDSFYKHVNRKGFKTYYELKH